MSALVVWYESLLGKSNGVSSVKKSVDSTGVLASVLTRVLEPAERDHSVDALESRQEEEFSEYKEDDVDEDRRDLVDSLYGCGIGRVKAAGCESATHRASEPNAVSSAANTLRFVLPWGFGGSIMTSLITTSIISYSRLLVSHDFRIAPVMLTYHENSGCPCSPVPSSL